MTSLILLFGNPTTLILFEALGLKDQMYSGYIAVSPVPDTY